MSAYLITETPRIVACPRIVEAGSVEALELKLKDAGSFHPSAGVLVNVIVAVVTIAGL